MLRRFCMPLAVCVLLLIGCRPVPPSDLPYLGAVHTPGQTIAGFDCSLFVFRAPEGAQPTWDFGDGASETGGWLSTYSDAVIGVGMVHTWEDPGTHTVRAIIDGVGYWEGEVSVEEPGATVDLLGLLGVEGQAVSAVVFARYAGAGSYACIAGDGSLGRLLDQLRAAHPVKARSMPRTGDPTKLHLMSASGAYLGAVSYRDGLLSLWDGSDQWLDGFYVTAADWVREILPSVTWETGWVDRGELQPGAYHRPPLPLPEEALAVTPGEAVEGSLADVCGLKDISLLEIGDLHATFVRVPEPEFPDHVAHIMSFLAACPPAPMPTVGPGGEVDWWSNPDWVITIEDAAARTVKISAFPRLGVIVLEEQGEPLAAFELTAGLQAVIDAALGAR